MGGLVAAAVVATAWIVAPLPGAEPGLQSSLKLAVLVGLATLIALRGHLERTAGTRDLALAAFVVSALVSAIAGAESFATSVPVVLGIGGLWVIARGARLAPEAGERAVAIACAGLVVVAALELLGLQLSWSWNRRPESTLGNRNHVAEYLVIALPLLVLQAMRGGRVARALVIAVITTIVVTHCRTAYLAACVAGLVAFGARRHRIPRWFAVAVLVAITAGVAPWPGVRFAQSAGDSLSRMFTVEGSGESRLAQHRRGFAAALSLETAVLGAGPGSWMRVAGTHAHASGEHAPRFSGAAAPNSEWLRTLVEQGALGLLGLLAIATSAFRAAARDIDRDRRAARIATLAAIAVVGTFDPLLTRPEIIALLAVVLARPGPSLVARPPVRIGSWLLVAAGAIATVVAGIRCASFVASSTGREAVAVRLWPRPGLVERRVLQLAHGGACEEADRLHAELEAERPYLWGARVALAHCYAKSDASSEARRVWRDALALEPHLRALVNQKEDR